jgi:hypothetical protein
MPYGDELTRLHTRTSHDAPHPDSYKYPAKIAGSGLTLTTKCHGRLRIGLACPGPDGSRQRRVV